MRLSWVIYAALGAAAVAGGVYYVTKVDVKVELPPAAVPAPVQSGPFPDTAGKLETARNPKFPHQGGGEVPPLGAPPRARSDTFGRSDVAPNSRLPDPAEKSPEQGSGAAGGATK